VEVGRHSAIQYLLRRNPLLWGLSFSSLRKIIYNTNNNNFPCVSAHVALKRDTFRFAEETLGGIYFDLSLELSGVSSGFGPVFSHVSW